jgi:DNA-binding NtrC family response regulator
LTNPASPDQDPALNPAHTGPLTAPRPQLTLDDEQLASRTRSRLLITGITAGDAETRARRIHKLSSRGECPFVRVAAGKLPVETALLRQTCARLLDRAGGGTIFIEDVEEMPPVVQAVLIELLAELESARDGAAAIRLVSGTSVSLFDCVAAGTFGEWLFYRLNIIHLTPTEGAGIIPS